MQGANAGSNPMAASQGQSQVKGLNNPGAPASAHVIDLKNTQALPSESPLLQDDSAPKPEVQKFAKKEPLPVLVNNEEPSTTTEPAAVAETPLSPEPIETPAEPAKKDVMQQSSDQGVTDDLAEEKTTHEQAEATAPKKRKPLKLVLIILGVLVLAAAISVGVLYLLSAATI